MKKLRELSVHEKAMALRAEKPPLKFWGKVAKEVGVVGHGIFVLIGMAVFAGGFYFIVKLIIGIIMMARIFLGLD